MCVYIWQWWQEMHWWGGRQLHNQPTAHAGRNRANDKSVEREIIDITGATVRGSQVTSKITIDMRKNETQTNLCVCDTAATDGVVLLFLSEPHTNVKLVS